MNSRPVVHLTPLELKQRLDNGESIALIDVREESEHAGGNIGGALIPKDTVPQHLDRIPREGPVVVYCRSGGRSSAVIDYLQRLHGYTNLMNLEGGMLRWANDIGPLGTRKPST